MKSTGEVLGVGKNLNEALYKGLTAAGRHIKVPNVSGDVGVFISVDKYDNLESVSLAKKLDDLGFKIYATTETAEHIAHLGTDVTVLGPDIGKDNREKLFQLMEEGSISFLVYTGALMDDSVNDYIALSRRALLLNIPCFTSLDTAMATADIIASRYSQQNTELVDINHMRRTKQVLEFSKMQATGDDYIFIENFKNEITCPESLALAMCDRHYGIGADGMVLIESSEAADAKMRIFNRDGSEGKMAGNSIRSVAKYLYDNGYAFSEDLTVETAAGIKKMHLYTRDGRVNYVEVDMGKADLSAAALPTTLEDEQIMNKAVTIGGKEYQISCCSIRNSFGSSTSQRSKSASMNAATARPWLAAPVPAARSLQPVRTGSAEKGKILRSNFPAETLLSTTPMSGSHSPATLSLSSRACTNTEWK